VLGDEMESLRAAKRELDRLTAQLESELARAARTNSALSNALAATMRSGTNQASGPGGTNELAGSRGTNGAGFRLDVPRAPNSTNVASARGGGTNQNLAMNSTNAGSRAASGTNSSGARDIASAQQNRDGQSGNQPGEQGGQRGDGNQRQTASAAQQNSNSPAGDQNNSSRNGNRGDRLAQMFNNQQQGGGQQQQTESGGPLTGEREFTEWNQRLSNVEEMVDRPALRNQIAQVRDRARAARAEFKRHSKDPQWDLVQMQILKPLVEVRDRVADELSRRESSESLAPIDRDPVPGKYGDLVRRYYEILGGSQ
jgi:hypothetical protein